MAYIRPANTLSLADGALWYLREVQDVVQVAHKAYKPLQGPAIEVHDLVDAINGAALAIDAFVELPGHENHFLALEIGGRRLHLLAGPRFAHAVAVDLEHHRAVRVTASPYGIYFLTQAGEVVRVPVLSVIQERGPASVGCRIVSLQKLGPQAVWTAPPAIPVSTVALAWTSMKPGRAGDAVVVCDRSLEHSTLVTVTATAVDRRPLEFKLSAEFRSSLSISYGFGGTGDQTILIDTDGARILSLDPFRNKPEVQVLAGDGVASAPHVLAYGPAVGRRRLQPLTSVCRFRLTQAQIDTLADLVILSPAQKLPINKASGLTKGDDRLQRVADLLRDLDFFVLFDGNSKLVSTLSTASSLAVMKKLIDQAVPQLWPLSPPRHSEGRLKRQVRDPFEVLLQSLGEATQVSPGPDSSLLFWAPGSCRLILLKSVTSQLSDLHDDEEFMKSLASKANPRVFFEDSSRFPWPLP